MLFLKKKIVNASSNMDLEDFGPATDVVCVCVCVCVFVYVVVCVYVCVSVCVWVFARGLYVARS